MTRSEILDTAKDYINKDRAATHGDAEDNFTTIAEFWATYLDLEWLDASDVAMMMVLFKAARFKNNPTHIDNTIDMAGYAALAGEIAKNKETETNERIRVEQSEGIRSKHFDDGESRSENPVCNCVSCLAERDTSGTFVWRFC